MRSSETNLIKSELKQRVDSILKALGLDSCSNIRVCHLKLLFRVG